MYPLIAATVAATVAVLVAILTFCLAAALAAAALAAAALAAAPGSPGRRRALAGRRAPARSPARGGDSRAELEGLPAELEGLPAELEGLPAELEGLPADIRKMVVLNPRARGLQADPEFLAAVGDPPALREIDRAISAGCVKEPSLYARSRAAVVDGYAVRVFPKGWHVYKTFLGFVEEEQTTRFAREHPDRPSWYGDKFLTYAIARSDWGTIVSFRLEEDLVLLDYFNTANLGRIVGELHDIELAGSGLKSPLSARDLVATLRRATGFGLEPADHVSALAHANQIWSSVWYYTDLLLPQNTAVHCEPRAVEGLNPVGVLKGVQTIDFAIFDNILVRHPAIDGIVREGIRSRLDESGAFHHEEYLLKGSALTSKTKFDRGDPVCWTNWAFKGFTPPASGLRLHYMISKFSSGLTISPNHQFSLAKFYIANDTPVRDLPGAGALPPRPHILAYNVHGFASLNADLPLEEMRSSIAALLVRYAPSVEIVALTEVSSANINAVNGILAAAGYVHIMSAPNGARDRSSLVVVAAKRPLAGAAKIVTDTPPPLRPRGAVKPIHRKQILFTTAGGLRGVALHLDIGRRYLAGMEGANDDRRAENSDLRIRQLTKVLEQQPDFLVGDFNFTLCDPESRFLEGRGYVPANSDHENSTPYNRVDHFFIRRELAGSLPAGGGNVLLHCNFSDHLPMLQALPP
jgi:endonuclease/exonuclease/phosphatase family metal-dependent hydrolase